jgi:hypothetical protein
LSIVGLRKRLIERHPSIGHTLRRELQTASHDRESTRRCSGPPARACPRRTSRHLDIATSTYGSPKGDVAVGSPKNLRQRQLILTPLVPIQRPVRHLVKDYNCGEIARAGIGFPQAYALRNRYALPAVVSFPLALSAMDSRQLKDERPSRLLGFASNGRAHHAAPLDSTPSRNRKLK